MPLMNPKTGKPYPNTPAGNAASKAEYLRRAKAAKLKKKKMPTKGGYKTPKPKAGAKKPKSRGY